MSDGTANFGDGAMRRATALARGFVPARSDHGLSAADQAAAGAVAKASSKLVLYPLDTWKSRRQADPRSSFRGLWTLGGMYRGLVPKVMLYAPYQAVYMAVYTRTRDWLVADSSGRLAGCGPLVFVLAGVSAELAGSVLRLPMEVAKLRLQLGLYRNTWHAAQELVCSPWSIYRNFVPQTLAHDCVYSACSWLVFESCRQQLFYSREMAELAPHESVVLGSLAGAVSAVVTTPLDVLKTRVVGRSPCDGRKIGLSSTAFEILRSEGVAAFWRGALLRVAHLSPSSGLYMFLYEAAKGQIAAWRGLAAH